MRDDDGDDFNRLALSGSVGYREGENSAGLKLEARIEDSIEGDLHDRDTFLVSGNLSLAATPDWTFVARSDAAFSSTDEESFLDGNYIESSVGFAYRPIDNDRFNALFKYSYLVDEPGPQQVNRDGVEGGPRQKSHIVSVDAIHDLTEKVSVGGKYAARVGEIADDSDGDYYFSSAHLAAARLDFHVINKWDFMVEGRAFWLPQMEQVHYGAVAALYRQVGPNLKFGVGYNFGRFSDDVADLTLDDGGVFVNLIGMY